MDLHDILADLRRQDDDGMRLGHADREPADPFISLEAAKHWIAYGRNQRPAVDADQDAADRVLAIGEAAERALLNAGIEGKVDFIGRRKPGEGVPEKIPPLDLHNCFFDWYGNRIGVKTHGGHGVRRTWCEVQVPKAALRRLWPDPLAALPMIADPPASAGDQGARSPDAPASAPGGPAPPGPDPLVVSHWSWPQALAWIRFRHPDALRPPPARDVVEQGLWEAAWYSTSEDRTGQPGIMSEVAAKAELLEALRAGELVCTGRLNGHGERQAIAAMEWLDLEICIDSRHGACAVRDAACLTAKWMKLRFGRQAVMAPWPAENAPIEQSSQPATPVPIELATDDRIDGEVKAWLTQKKREWGSKPMPQKDAWKLFMQDTGKYFKRTSFVDFYKEVIGMLPRGPRATAQ